MSSWEANIGHGDRFCRSVVSIILLLNDRETYVLRVIGNGAGWIELVIWISSSSGSFVRVIAQTSIAVVVTMHVSCMYVMHAGRTYQV